MTRQARRARPGRCGRRLRRWNTWRCGWWARDEGRVSAFVVTVLVAILALAGLTLDGGLALADKVRANGQAEAAARAGAQALDLGA
ncbi:MAG: pilus assembly protein TadG-related protein, partial [Actinomycetes bacterium]